MDSKEASLFYIFRAPIDKVYNIFINPQLFTCTFFQNCKMLSMMHEENSLDSSGNEVTLLWNKNVTLTFRIDNAIDLPYFKMFTHRSISTPSNFSPFEHTFSFFWNSTDKVTVFKFTSWVRDTKDRESITKYIIENKDSMCFSTENYLMTTLTNLEENESISINKPIEDVWNFLNDINNQKFFYPNAQSIKISTNEEGKVSIEDEDNKTKTTFNVVKNEINDDKKQLALELIAANVSLPKQRIEFQLIRMDNAQCFIIFKHIILEFIPFDILMSYSSSKKKVLRRVKNILEGKGDKFD